MVKLAKAIELLLGESKVFKDKFVSFGNISQHAINFRRTGITASKALRELLDAWRLVAVEEGEDAILITERSAAERVSGAKISNFSNDTNSNTLVVTRTPNEKYNFSNYPLGEVIRILAFAAKHFDYKLEAAADNPKFSACVSFKLEQAMTPMAALQKLCKEHDLLMLWCGTQLTIKEPFYRQVESLPPKLKSVNFINWPYHVWLDASKQIPAIDADVVGETLLEVAWMKPVDKTTGKWQIEVETASDFVLFLGVEAYNKRGSMFWRKFMPPM